MAHKYKLTYFNLRGRAERIRLMFALAGVDYEDKRIGFSEWPALKPDTPFGQLPILEIDNGATVLAQTKAIGRYLAKELGFAPKDNIEAAKADMWVDAADDVVDKFGPGIAEKDPVKKKEIYKQVTIDHVIPFLKLCEKFLTGNGTVYFVNNTITWADLTLFNFFDTLQMTGPDLFNDLPKLVEFIKKIGGEPKIRDWIEKRPKTEF